jgi:hypothetical protein
MSLQAESASALVGLFLNPVGQRRVDFQRVCGEQFGRLFLADGTEQTWNASTGVSICRRWVR